MRFVKAMVHIIQNAEKSDSSIRFYPIFGILIVSFYLSVFSALACTLHLRTTIQLCLICTTILFIRPPSNTPIKLPLLSFARSINSKALPSTKNSWCISSVTAYSTHTVNAQRNLNLNLHLPQKSDTNTPSRKNSEKCAILRTVSSDNPVFACSFSASVTLWLNAPEVGKSCADSINITAAHITASTKYRFFKLKISLKIFHSF